jgi:hypothetical protein
MNNNKIVYGALFNWLNYIIKMVVKGTGCDDEDWI